MAEQSRLEKLSELTEPLTLALTNDAKSWTGFLDSAAKMYKYTFDDQVLIHAQRPEATACAPLELWNKTFNRWIKKGSKGIALIDKTGLEPHLRYVFDIADTRESRDSKPPYIWKLEPEHETLVAEALKVAYEAYEKSPDDGLKAQVMELSKNLAEKRLGENEENENPQKEPWEQETWTQILASSVGYVVLSRCGMDAGELTELTESFQDINKVSDLVDISDLGEITGELARDVLSKIENTVKCYERQKAREQKGQEKGQEKRSVEHDGDTVSQGRGLPDTRPDADRQDGAPDREIRTNETDVPGEPQEGPLLGPAAQGDADGAPGGDRGDGAGADRTDNFGGAEAQPAPGQGGEPDGLGQAHEQPAHYGGGDRNAGADLQLEPATEAAPPPNKSVIFPTEEEQKETIAVQAIQAQTEKSARPDALYMVGDAVYLKDGNEYRIERIRESGHVEVSEPVPAFPGATLTMSQENFEKEFYENIFNQGLIAERRQQRNGSIMRDELPSAQSDTDGGQTVAPVTEHAGETPERSASTGQSVLLPTVYDEHGNYNREGKRKRVTAAEPIGKYQIYTSKDKYNLERAYVMTDSGRLLLWGDVNSWNLTEKYIDRNVGDARLHIEEALKDPNQWADYNSAALVNRLQEADEHNAPIREAKAAKNAEKAAARAAERKAEAQERELAFNSAVDEIGHALASGKRADVPKNFDRNPLLALFDLYEVNVPLRTKGWINKRVRALQLDADRVLSVWGSAKEITAGFSGAIKELRDAVVTTPRSASGKLWV